MSEIEDQSGNVIPFAPREIVNDKPVIRIKAGELHSIATSAEDVLLDAQAPFYVRGEQLMRPVVDDLPASSGRRAKVARLAAVTEPTMIDHLSRMATWQKWDGRSNKWVAADPSPKIAATILSRDGEWRFPRLSGVITTPTLRPDGTILSEPGYDAQTQLLLIDPPEMPKIPSKPSRKGAIDALGFLDKLLDEFPFADAASRSVALSALITPVVRGALPVTPMHVTKAPVAGSGKSYIIDLASAINSGERAPVLSAGKTEEEMEKRLVSALLAGQTFISLDNVNGDLGGDFLCQMIERPVVSARPLGQSTFVKIESRASCFATGNNIRLVGDMVRRVLVCSLDPDMERPELREFKKNPFDQVLAQRGRYIAAALIVVRAYVVAGSPNQLLPLASFEEWSNLVRSALVWLGKPDPVDTILAAREDDPAISTLRQVLSEWSKAALEAPKTASEIVNMASEHLPDGGFLRPALREALVEAVGDAYGGVKTVSFGKYLAKHKNRVVSGLKLVEGRKNNDHKILWSVTR